MKYTIPAFLAAAMCAAAFVLPSFGSALPIPSSEAFPYGGPVFTSYIADSDHATGGGTPAQFYQWMDQAPLAQESHGLLAMADAEHSKLTSLKTPAEKTAEEKRYCAALHHMVKTRIPRFSLYTGFEFTDAMRLGTRQCLLQSVLLSGLLQRAGIDAGMVMVWRNIGGEEINDGHCVSLVHFPNGQAAELDASDSIPFVRHTGLLVDEHGLRNVAPIFNGDTPFITGFKAVGNGRDFPVKDVRPLSVAYVRSQFYYYRGERTTGGLLAAHPTRAGLAQEAEYLRTSIHDSPQNELSVYMLGRVLLKQGHIEEARSLAHRALRIYADAGWTPSGARQLAEEVTPPMRDASSMPRTP